VRTVPTIAPAMRTTRTTWRPVPAVVQLA
jgi:hypothetical protein